MFNTLNSLGMSDLHLHFLLYIFPRLGVFRLKRFAQATFHMMKMLLSKGWGDLAPKKMQLFQKGFHPAVGDCFQSEILGRS